LYGAEAWELSKVDRKYMKRFEMWCWRRMENISWTGRVRSVEVMHRVKEERNILHAIKRRKVNWIGHILRKRFSKTRYWQKDRKTDRSFGRTRKKT
jgi:hypothetical protein